MRGRGRIGWLVSLASIAVAGTLGASAGDLGRCETARVEGPLVLPDGTLHQARSVQLCYSREYSPVEGLHRISVDGRPIGLFLGREYAAESERDRAPYLLFERDPAGQLELRGYAARGRLHDLAPDTSGIDAVVHASWRLVTQR